MVRIVRDAGGVPGLHVAYDCFTEEVEERLFLSGDETSFFQHALGGPATATATRTGNAPRHPMSWPADYTRVCNLIRDCGLVPDLVPPDYCLPLLYPPGAGFALHFDSRYRWAEVIVGVSLGQDGEMMFLPTKDDDKAALAARAGGKTKTARVKLPRRSIYVMSGPSRLDWKHGIVQQKPAEPPPSWNPHNLRKSLTFRSTKVFSDVYFERALRQRQNSAERNSLLARQRAQARFPPRDAQGEALTSEVLQKERSLAHQVLQLMESGLLPADLRFRQDEVTFPLPPGVTNRTVSEPIQNATTAGASAGSASSFQGEGYRLGTGHNDASGGGDEVQQAINASLRSLAAERAKRKQSGAGRGDSSFLSSASSSSPTKRGRKGDRGSGGGAVIDLAGESDDEAEEKKQDDGDEMDGKMPANKGLDGDDDDIIVID